MTWLHSNVNEKKKKIPKNHGVTTLRDSENVTFISEPITAQPN